MYEFWIVPMVNIDGVVIGNYRTNLQGKDMNRSFIPIDENVNNTLKDQFAITVKEVEDMQSYIKKFAPAYAKG
jgi:hypothetical protein